ncbi:MAG: RNA-binding protein S1 [Armatimonadetes bacterium CG07_land_8_20_14_0_80_40_9]|nr:MAG: RNA-binding protein S1 [Armatimonadetes bacterium CG07_land_8_20_14_0_80_40_9]
MPLKIGDIVEGIVVGIKNFGAFVQLPEGKVGLVHISEVDDSFVEDIKLHLKERDKVKVKILSVSKDGKLDLSIRGAKPGAVPRKPRGEFTARGKEERTPLSFEDRLERFLKESEERQLDLKKNIEAKRGKRRGKK